MDIKITKNKEREKRLVIDVPSGFHKLIKNRANNLGISVRMYVLKALIEQEKREIDIL